MNTAVVVRTGLTLARRQVWHAGRPQRGLLPLTLVLLLAGATWLGLGTVFDTLASTQAPAAWSANVLAWAFMLATLMGFVGALHVAVSALVADRDLERLRATPLASHELLALKAAATLPRTLPPVIGIALPAALAFVAAQPDTPGAAWRIALAMLTLWAVPMALALGVALPLLRMAPPSRLRESLAVLATVAFLAGWLANAFWVPRVLSDGTALAAGLRALPAAPAWAPANWAALLISASEPLTHALACATACVLALAGAAALAQRLLGSLHARLSERRGRTVHARARRAPTLANAFLRRDAALAGRDWPVLLDALAQFALWTLLPLAVLPVAPLPPLELARAMLITLCVSLGNDVAARALPLERESLAWARLSPVGGARWVRMRALGVAIVGGTLIALALVLVSVALHLELAESLDALAFAIAAAASLGGAGLALGAHLGDPAWTDPRAMLGPGGRSAAAVTLLTLAAGWLALSHVVSPLRPLGPLALVSIVLAGLALGAAALQIAAHRLEHQEFTSR
ncbi:MAG: hypothetical protein K8R56_07320 [Candidatus Eisenbacteria bacterium]|nr:hypothetical protein [Candidatus Eisenbacteria bacterium]